MMNLVAKIRAAGEFLRQEGRKAARVQGKMPGLRRRDPFG